MNNKLTTFLTLSPSQKQVHTFLDDTYQLLQSLTDAVGELKKYDGIEQDLESLQDYIDSASEQVTTLAESID
jgi:DNA repair ATPase RecN